MAILVSPVASAPRRPADNSECVGLVFFPWDNRLSMRLARAAGDSMLARKRSSKFLLILPLGAYATQRNATLIGTPKVL